MPLAPIGSEVVALTPLCASVDNGSLMVLVPFLITTRAENAGSIECQEYSGKYVNCTVLLEQEGKDSEPPSKLAPMVITYLGRSFRSILSSPCHLSGIPGCLAGATRYTSYLLPPLPPLSLSSSGIGSLSPYVNLMKAPFRSLQSAALHYEATKFVSRQNLFPLEHTLRERRYNGQGYFLSPSTSKDKIYASRSGSRTSARNDCAGAVIPSFSSSGRSS